MILTTLKNSKSFLLALLLLAVFIGNNANAQVEKKNASLSVQYTKISKVYSFLTISAKYKNEKGFQPCGNLNVTFYKIDTTGTIEPIKIGALKTHADGKVKFIIPQK